MKTAIIEFTIDDTKYKALVRYVSNDGNSKARILSVHCAPALGYFYLESLEEFLTSLKNLLSPDALQNQEQGVATVGNPTGELTVKPNLVSVLKHVLSGRSGDMVSWLEDIRKMAESEMSEEEKKTSKELIVNIFKFSKGL